MILTALTVLLAAGSPALAIDTKKRMSDKLEVAGIPHVILIDPSGIVRWEGYPLLQGDELSAKVVGDIIAKYSQ